MGMSEDAKRLITANRELSKQLAIVTAERDKLRGLLGKIIDTIRIDEDE